MIVLQGMNGGSLLLQGYVISGNSGNASGLEWSTRLTPIDWTA